jgi:hypothetical protein
MIDAALKVVKEGPGPAIWENVIPQIYDAMSEVQRGEAKDIVAWMSFDGKMVKEGQFRDPRLDPWLPLYDKQFNVAPTPKWFEWPKIPIPTAMPVPQSWIPVDRFSVPVIGELVVGLFPSESCEWIADLTKLIEDPDWDKDEDPPESRFIWADMDGDDFYEVPKFWMPVPVLPKKAEKAETCLSGPILPSVMKCPCPSCKMKRTTTDE